MENTKAKELEKKKKHKCRIFRTVVEALRHIHTAGIPGEKQMEVEKSARCKSQNVLKVGDQK